MMDVSNHIVLDVTLVNGRRHTSEGSNLERRVNGVEGWRAGSRSCGTGQVYRLRERCVDPEVSVVRGLTREGEGDRRSTEGQSSLKLVSASDEGLRVRGGEVSVWGLRRSPDVAKFRRSPCEEDIRG